MKILGVDTSTPSGSVSIMEDGRLIDSLSSPESESFSRSLLSTIEKLLLSNSVSLEDIDALGVAIGPGSFTGIRIGIASLKGISHAVEIPLHGVSTLTAMVYRQRQVSQNTAHTLSPLLDAGRGEVYTATFSISGDNKIGRMIDDRKIPYSDLQKNGKECGLFFGEYPKELSQKLKMIYNSGGVKSDAILSAGVAEALYASMNGGDLTPSASVVPNYLNKGPVKG